MKSKTAFFDLDGKHYYFASKKTMKRFQENPNEFTAAPRSENLPK